MDASTSANAGNGRYQQHRAADLPQQQYAAAVPVPVPVAAIPVATAIPYSSSSHQLRPPPVRYASSSAGTLPQHSHLKRTGRGYPADEATCTCVLPRTSVLCRLLVAMSVLLVCVQAVSCGMFFCVRLPIIHSRGPFVEYQDLVADFSQPALSAMKQPAAQQTLQQPVSAVPNLIPRVIHQTYSNGRMPASAKSFMKSWSEVNGETWQVGGEGTDVCSQLLLSIARMQLLYITGHACQCSRILARRYPQPVAHGTMLEHALAYSPCCADT